jgi:hypothetical protein
MALSTGLLAEAAFQVENWDSGSVAAESLGVGNSLVKPELPSNAGLNLALSDRDVVSSPLKSDVPSMPSSSGLAITNPSPVLN